jgi:predicted RNase H-like nuclease (RuvC/YqgF family)
MIDDNEQQHELAEQEKDEQKTHEYMQHLDDLLLNHQLMFKQNDRLTRKCENLLKQISELETQNAALKQKIEEISSQSHIALMKQENENLAAEIKNTKTQLAEKNKHAHELKLDRDRISAAHASSEHVVKVKQYEDWIKATAQKFGIKIDTNISMIFSLLNAEIKKRIK